MLEDKDRKPLIDLEPKSGVEAKFQLLSNPSESVHPIDAITDEDVREMRNALEKSGYKLNFQEPHKALVEESLRGTQFRGITGRMVGRGFAVCSAAVTLDRAESLLKTATEISEKNGGSESFKTGGENIGVRHLVADFLGLAILPTSDREKIVKHMNQRVWKGHKRALKNNPDKLEVVDASFSQIAVPNWKLLASVPPQTVLEVWQSLLSK